MPQLFAGALVAMQIFLDYLPIVFFFVTYAVTKEIYVAIVALMIVAPIVFAGQWFLTRKINKISAASTALVVILGGITLALDNPWFFYWKPTILNWAIAVVFLGGHLFGGKPVVQRMLELAVQDKDEQILMTRTQWVKLNFIWVAFFVISGALNIYVAYNYSESTWVSFKLFGLLGLTIVFVILQSLWIARNVQSSQSASSDSES